MRIHGKRIRIDSARFIGKAFSLFLSLLTCVAAANAQSKYTITDLGTLGGTYSAGYGVSQSGQVTGEGSLLNGSSHTFLYNGSEMIDAGTLGGSYSMGLSVNTSGQVAGRANTSNGSSHAFLYRAGVMTDLGTLGGGLVAEAKAVNDNGEVVGEAVLSSGYTHGFYFRNKMVDIGSLFVDSNGGSYSTAVGINNSGLVAGNGSSPVGGTHAITWSLGGPMRDLGTLGGDPAVTVEKKATKPHPAADRNPVVGLQPGAELTHLLAENSGEWHR